MRTSTTVFTTLIIAAFLIPVSVMAASCPDMGPNCPGKACARLGTTQLADDNTNLIACLKTSETNTTLSWKSMTVTPASNLDIVKVTTSLCKWGGVYTIVADCPAGYELLGCGGGEGDLLESGESWMVDPDFTARRCVGKIRQPACDGTSDQAAVIASCYKP